MNIRLYKKTYKIQKFNYHKFINIYNKFIHSFLNGKEYII